MPVPALPLLLPLPLLLLLLLLLLLVRLLLLWLPLQPLMPLMLLMLRMPLPLLPLLPLLLPVLSVLLPGSNLVQNVWPLESMHLRIHSGRCPLVANSILATLPTAVTVSVGSGSSRPELFSVSQSCSTEAKFSRKARTLRR